MSQREARELALLRHQLREHLLAQDARAAAAPLSRLLEVAHGDRELAAEYERWAFRFELLAA
ncbi:MAG: hypothetical protein KBG48_21290 [Kofleriaceae bacterium]|jgi:hypothetical protein|nr:hypothetical protein [Kofleriaceae bacterium]MBP9169953.1 hypothetical protein [Kofleriaceae bacterium]MBP9862537.1 hypothetical protein [Kofleriaceae bacterium]